MRLRPAASSPSTTSPRTRRPASSACVTSSSRRTERRSALRPMASATASASQGCRRSVARVGADFDNTLANYDELLRSLTAATGCLGVDGSAGKRAAPGAGARTIDSRRVPLAGALDFLERARAAHVVVHVASHKTRRAPADPDGSDPHEAALGSLEANGFFAVPASLIRAHVHSSRPGTRSCVDRGARRQASRRRPG
jgi:hypothetical protein